ncbi:FAD-dependent oxidoreductase [Neorhizobium galegae]|uniref:FAD-dependent oxidoreductase n=1 Tax=Neorhizobium galegae TaxID=399 RepID=UPI000621B8E4|nr:FAD-dependent oxidoreductase [Neorhizobium galegae]CDZ28944.1 Invasion protein IbeA [Neorhizobium galegae bv. officinalis]KAA9385408.1 FAD-dependent oxidoreductase [Neorhizobium galegae]KAB1113123.1 FAD-dependent oxidoreductase [Neorhizobium galegae]MCM2499376.1 FAD-dependent oxidoreductase [Neorhizobium galegae]MCQ1773943.1 FAD-dependent oxidoreductase [Neorhizobium galegae]
MAETLSRETRIVRREKSAPFRKLKADICVVGAGIAGISAALEAARLGRKVVIVDGQAALGGQAVNSIIATFCGLFSNGTHGYQFTYGVADRLLAHLESQDRSIYYRHGPNTTVVYYDEVVLGRWMEQSILEAGIEVVLGAQILDVHVEGRRVVQTDFMTRYGGVSIEATGWVEASGDAALVWQAGFACRQPEKGGVFGTQMVVLENIDEARQPTRYEIGDRMKEKAASYGLLRREGLGFTIPGRGIAAMNMTHVETPLDPVEASKKALEGKDQAARAVEFLKAEFPECFGNARIRSFGLPGIRQTRWIAGSHHLTVDEIKAGTKFDDAVARTAWPIELHDHGDGHHWITFDEQHAHYIPLGSLTPDECDNIAAAGRCVDADSAALSSIRVMGPCIAMGMAAANALDLAGTGSVHQIDRDALRERVSDNVEKKHYRWTGAETRAAS